MSSNEIANHIEAACWLRYGPDDAEVPGITSPRVYFRSQNGFVNTIGVVDPLNPLATPGVLLQLDRYYRRSEVAIHCFNPVGVDLVQVPPNPFVPAFYPSAAMLQPLVLTVDSRFVYNEVPTPVTPEEVVEVFDHFNALYVVPQMIAPEDESGAAETAADICALVIRIPRAANGPEAVTLRQVINGF